MPKKTHRRNTNVYFYDFGLSGVDETGRTEGWDTLTLGSIMKQLGHDNVSCHIQRCILVSLQHFIEYSTPGQKANFQRVPLPPKYSGYDGDKFIRQSKVCMTQSKLMVLGSD